MPSTTINFITVIIIRIRKFTPEEVPVILLKPDDSQQVATQLCDTLLLVDHTQLNNADKKYPVIVVLAVNVTTVLTKLLVHVHHVQPE